MTESHRQTSQTSQTSWAASTAAHNADAAARKHGRKRSLSMHDGIAVWCDCCSCEAEPYWVEAAAEMGMDLGSDYEDGYTDRKSDSGTR
jgi:hypothetical protein